MQSAMRQLNHYFCQTLFFHIKSKENQSDNIFRRMYVDKLSGAVAMVDLLPCDQNLKDHAKYLSDFVDKLDNKSNDEIVKMLEKTRT